MADVPLPEGYDAADYGGRSTGPILYTADHMRQYAAAVSAAKDERIQVLETAIQHYDAALKVRWPEGAMGEAYVRWNAARAALGDKNG